MTVNSDAAQQPDADTQPVADKPTGAGDPPRLDGRERAGRPELRRGGAGPGPQRRPSREGTFPFTTETIKLHHGGLAVAVASDEAHNGSGRVDEWKRQRQMGVGADIVIPDFRDGPLVLARILDL